MIKASDVRLAQTAATPADLDDALDILCVADFKLEHRIGHSAEDDKIEDCIKEAYNRLDGPNGHLNRAILTQTWVGYINAFDDTIELPIPVLQSVTSIEYRDTDGDWQTLSSSVYGTDINRLVGIIYLNSNQSWPTIYTEPSSIRITFKAGYGDGDDVLEKAYGIRKALKLLGGHFFFNPTPTFVEPRLVEVPRKVWFSLQYVLGQYRIVKDHS